ncbi:MAG: glucose 1-dehydrogenase [Pseudomonadota bacterium]
MGKLDGKVALITGAAQGMGAAHARVLAAEGAKVVLTDVQEAEGHALAESIGESAMFVAQDVTDPDSWTKVVAEAEKKFGPVTVLVNNAGIIGPLANTTDIAFPDYEKVIAINQHGVFYGMRAVIPGMIAAGGGAIVNISSIAGMIACFGFPNVAYVASKFAVRGMTKATAAEFGKYGIRVNSIHPGFILTPMMVAATDENGGGAAEMTMLKRMAKPEEVSRLVVFLACEDSSFITGMEHIIDGGMTAQ